MHIKFAAALLPLAAAAMPAAAIPLTISGVYTGTVNGTPISATATGTIDTAGPGGSMSVLFTSIPNLTFTPLALGSSFVTVVCWSAAQALDGMARNLFDLSGGNYALNRTFTWDGLPGSALNAAATVNLAGGALNFVTNLSGTYNGPTDLTGVQDYRVHWNQGGATDVQETGQATLLRTGGGALGMHVATTYSGLTQMLLAPQDGAYFPAPVYTPTGPLTGDFATTWRATMRTVPEPSSLALSGLALLLMRLRKGRRR